MLLLVCSAKHRIEGRSESQQQLPQAQQVLCWGNREGTSKREQMQAADSRLPAPAVSGPHVANMQTRTEASRFRSMASMDSSCCTTLTVLQAQFARDRLKLAFDAAK